MKDLLDEYLRQKEVIDQKIKELSAQPYSYERNKELLIASDIQYDLAVAIKEIKQYVLE